MEITWDLAGGCISSHGHCICFCRMPGAPSVLGHLKLILSSRFLFFISLASSDWFMLCGEQWTNSEMKRIEEGDCWVLIKTLEMPYSKSLQKNSGISNVIVITTVVVILSRKIFISIFFYFSSFYPLPILICTLREHNLKTL